jgi:hypothetical protein
MATFIAGADGNFTAAATWDQVETGTGAVQSAVTSSSSTTLSYAYSSAFTGTNTNVCDGLLMNCRRNNTTGTVTVALSDDNGVTATRTVTVNASDLPATASWVFFKFGSSLTLDGGTDYRVGVVGSASGNATFFRDATANNWSRYLRLTATAASIAAGDIFFIAGEYTAAATFTARNVTMDSTATTQYGAINICPQGKLEYGTSASTNYNLTLAGDLTVFEGGTLNIGTSGTPIPRTSTAVLEFVCTSAGQYGLIVTGTFNSYGLSRTAGKDIYFCKLNANASAGATSLTVDTDTGWLNGDVIGLAPTTRSYTQSESRTLNANATATGLSISSGLTNARDGTAPTQAEIINLTRNVKIRANATAAANATYLRFLTTSTVNIYWTEISYIGANTSTRYGIVQETTTGSCNMQYCSIHDMFYYHYISSTSGSSITNRYNVYYNTGTLGLYSVLIDSTTGINTFSDNLIIYSLATSSAIQLSDVGGYFDNNVIAGCNRRLLIAETGAQILSISNNVVHSSSDNGVQIGNFPAGVIDGLKCWRNNTGGIISAATSSYPDLELKNCELFGNASYSLSLQYAGNLTLTNITSYSEGSYTTTTALSITASGIIGQMKLINCEFSPAGKTAHTQDINISGASYVNMELNNCVLGAATEVASPSNLSTNSQITSSKHDKTAGVYKTWRQNGVITRDTTIFNTAAPSERLTPTSATIKLPSGSRIAAVNNGATLTVSVYIRKSAAGDGAAYNGNQPRLILARNDALGITANTVLATYTGGTGSWAQITGTTAAVTDDGALEFYVDCDGTLGWINIDDWSVV